MTAKCDGCDNVTGICSVRALESPSRIEPPPTEIVRGSPNAIQDLSSSLQLLTTV